MKTKKITSGELVGVAVSFVSLKALGGAGNLYSHSAASVGSGVSG
jgi:hypothetical protein